MTIITKSKTKKKKTQKMKNKQEGDKIPLFNEKIINRKCAACSKIQDRNNMVRIMKKHGSNEVFINPDNKTFGRSVYICKNGECLKKVLKKNKISKIIKINLEENVIKQIESVLN